MLYASADIDDNHHQSSLDLLETHPGPLIVPVLVIPEVTHLFSTRLGFEPEKRLLDDLAAGSFVVAPVLDTDWQRIGELVTTYRDMKLGTVDSSVVATAEST